MVKLVHLDHGLRDEADVLRFGVLIFCALALAGAAQAQDSPAAAVGPLPAKAFFADPVFSNAALSPDAHYLAIVQKSDDFMGLVITDLTTGQSHIAMSMTKDDKPLEGLSVDWVAWKGDDRLVMGLTEYDLKGAGGKLDTDIVHLRYGRFVMAVDRDGKNSTPLLRGDMFNADRGRFVSLMSDLPKDPEHILVEAPDTHGEPAAWKVDIHTGDAIKVEEADNDVDSWFADDLGHIVARVRDDNSGVVVEGRAPGQTAWTTIIRIRKKDLKVLDDYQVLGAADKIGQIYVAVKPTTPAEGETRRVRIYDLMTKTLSDPVWPMLKYDVADIVYYGDTKKMAGVCYTADVYRCDFSDKEISATFHALEGYFGPDKSIVPIDFAQDNRWWLFSVTSPQGPAAYYLFDWKTKQIQEIAARYDQLGPDTLAEVRPWTYKARDGLAIPGYLTVPPHAPKGPLPLIVLPHGGPEARDALEFDPWAQFLATRGYLVFQPNFRGSGGYGVSFVDSGHQRWGGAMADDITDGVQALIASGQVDPKRICIFGASYGGYAALYAGATHPELYKCVVSWAGISDLKAWLKYKSFLGNDSETYRYLVKEIGDPDTQAAALIKASPVTYAESYQPPVLLIHGDSDGNVPERQSEIMRDALKAAHKDVRLEVYRYEDHSYWQTENETKAIGQVADFITAHIAPAKLAWPAPVQAAADDKTASATPAAAAKSAN